MFGYFLEADFLVDELIFFFAYIIISFPFPLEKFQKDYWVFSDFCKCVFMHIRILVFDRSTRYFNWFISLVFLESLDWLNTIYFTLIANLRLGSRLNLGI